MAEGLPPVPQGVGDLRPSSGRLCALSEFWGGGSWRVGLGTAGPPKPPRAFPWPLSHCSSGRPRTRVGPCCPGEERARGLSSREAGACSQQSQHPGRFSLSPTPRPKATRAGGALCMEDKDTRTPGPFTGSALTPPQSPVHRQREAGAALGPRGRGALGNCPVRGPTWPSPASQVAIAPGQVPGGAPQGLSPRKGPQKGPAMLCH